MIKKVHKKILVNVMLSLILGIVANSLWLYEIVSIIGWKGLEWLNHEHKSIFVINGFVILAYCFPLWAHQEVQVKQKSKLFTFLLLYVLTLIAFFIAKFFLYNFLFYFNLLSWSFLVFLPLTPLLIYWISHKRIHPLKKQQIALLFLSVPLSIFLSNITIEYFPGFGYSSNFIDGVKMGYPYFWITIIMNGIGTWTSEKLLIDARFEKEFLTEDILDA